MNLWEKYRKKSGVTKIEIAKELGIDEKKLEEVEQGKREMPKNKIDDYLKAINKLSNKQRNLKIAEARVWYENVDLTKKIKEFGLKNQREFAEIIGCRQSTVSEWCTKKRKIGVSYLLKIYYFFNDEFNKKVNEKVEIVKVKPLADQISEYNKEMVEWYNKTDFSKLLEEKKITQKELCRQLNIPFSTFNNWIRKISASQKGIETLYNIFNGGVEFKTKEKEPIANIEEEKENNEEETANYYQVLDQEETTPTYTISTTIDTPMEEDTTEEDLCRLKEENERLRKQIARYEMLIDMAIRKEN